MRKRYSIAEFQRNAALLIQATAGLTEAQMRQLLKQVEARFGAKKRKPSLMKGGQAHG